MLESRFPASIFWGPEMLHFYNDAYLPLSSEKHPRLLGQPAAEAWSEAWHIIGPQFAAVLKDGLSIVREGACPGHARWPLARCLLDIQL